MKKIWVIILLYLLLVLRCEFYEPPRDNRDDPNGDDYIEYHIESSIIGTKGPGGGFIFHDRGEYADGWRYMEVMLNTEKASWGCLGTFISGADDKTLGGGIRNTNDIVTQCNEIGTAAYVCANLTQNGYNDWFLPNWKELATMDGALRVLDPYYAFIGWSWTSIQYDSTIALFYRSSLSNLENKYSPLYVYCMRVF